MKTPMFEIVPSFELNIPDSTGQAEEAPAAEAPATPETEAGDPATESSTPETTNAATPSPDAEQKFEIKVDGKTELLTREEIIALAQQGKDYTRKTQEVAEERRRLGQEKQQLINQEREKWVKQQQEEARRRQEEANMDPGQRALSRLQTLEQQREDDALDYEIRDILKAHDGVTEQELLNAAGKMGLRNAQDLKEHGKDLANQILTEKNTGFEKRFSEVLAKGDHPALKKLKDEIVAAYLKDKAKGAGPVTTASGPAAAPGNPVKKIRTFDEAQDAATEMLANSAAG